MDRWNSKTEWKKLVLETQLKCLTEASGSHVQTWGDLKQLLAVSLKAKDLKKLEKGGEATGKLAKNLLNLTPVGWVKSGLEAIGQAKDVYDVVKMTDDLPDEKAEQSPLFKYFNIDPSYSEMLDDRLETEFLKWLSDYISQRSDNEAIPDVSVNKFLEQFLKKKYPNKETVTNAPPGRKFSDIEMPEEKAKWKENIKSLGKGFFSGLI